MRHVCSKVTAIVAVCSGLAACGGADSSSNPQPRWYYEAELAADPELRADPSGVVILDLSGELGEVAHRLAYEHADEADYVYCLDDTDSSISRVEIFAADDDEPLVRLAPGTSCVHRRMPAGQYSYHVYHSPVPESPANRVGFVHQAYCATSAATTPPPVPASPSFGALRVVGGVYDGRYVTVPAGCPGMDRSICAGLLEALPPSGTATSVFAALGHLFSFTPSGVAGRYTLHSYTSGWTGLPELPLSYIALACDKQPAYCVDSQIRLPGGVVVPAFASILEPEQVDVEARDDGSFVLWTTQPTFVLPRSTLVAAPETGVLYFTVYAKDSSTQPTVFKLDPRLRFYQDGSQVGTLQPGEVALFEGCNYSGRAFVINASIDQPALVHLPAIASVKLGGPCTNALVHVNGTPPIETLGKDTPCLAQPIAASSITLIEVIDAYKQIFSTSKCEYCYLAGADFSGKNLDRVDLRSANLSRTTWTRASLESADFRSALLYGANINYANLAGANLCQAFLNGSAESNNEAATLVGSYLKNVNLAHANLNGVTFADTNFYGESDSLCAPANCGFTSGCATAAGASLNSADFSNAYLSGVDLSGSDPRGAVFSNAILTGVHFDRANLARDPSSNARTDFSGAFIGGTSFADATATGSTFTNAYVDFSDTGNCMLFRLAGGHTNFTGYWNEAGDSPCVLFAYSNATVPPLTDSENVCPNGGPGPCDGRWESPAVPMDHSPQPASTCTADAPICSFDQIDSIW